MEQRKVRITAGEVEVTAVLNDSHTADLVWSALPIDADGGTWGNELFVHTSIVAEPEDPREVLDLGTLAYYPPAKTVCMFFGPTPESRSEDEIRPSDAVNVVGRIEGDPLVLKQASTDPRVVIERA